MATEYLLADAATGPTETSDAAASSSTSARVNGYSTPASRQITQYHTASPASTTNYHTAYSTKYTAPIASHGRPSSTIGSRTNALAYSSTASPSLLHSSSVVPSIPSSSLAALSSPAAAAPTNGIQTHSYVPPQYSTQQSRVNPIVPSTSSSLAPQKPLSSIYQPLYSTSSLASLPKPQQQANSTSRTNPLASTAPLHTQPIISSAAPSQSSLAPATNATPAAIPSPSSAAVAASLGIEPALEASMSAFLSTFPLPMSQTEFHILSHASMLNTRELPLKVGSFIDVRDPLGKYLEAQVIKVDFNHITDSANTPMDISGGSLANMRIRVHYSGWDSQWDEDLIPIQDPTRIQPHRSWSKGSSSKGTYAVVAAVSTLPTWVRSGELVVVYFKAETVNVKRKSAWLMGRINKFDGPQVQVDIYPEFTEEYAASLMSSEYNVRRKVQRWFHVRSDLIRPMSDMIPLQQKHEQQQQLTPSRPVSSPVNALPSPPSRTGIRPSDSKDFSPMPSQTESKLSGISSPFLSSKATAHSSGLASAVPNSSVTGTPSSTSSAITRATASIIASSPSPSNSSIGISSSITNSSTSPSSESETSSSPTSSSSSTFFVGQFIEVKDSANKFLPAEVQQVQGDKIHIHFEGWSKRWDEWINTADPVASLRIRALGSALTETEEEIQKKASEAAFRARLKKEHGFEVFDCDRDGNCLFRAMSHQIYGSVERHAELRRRCYDHMEANRSYFANYMSEEFDSYVAKRRQDKEWGDHLEIVALREIFNINVEIYNHDTIIGGQVFEVVESGKNDRSATTKSKSASTVTVSDVPSTTASLPIPLIRLSFHGNNHYNSVIDPAHPPPLGDGASCPYSIRTCRIAQEEKEQQEEAARVEKEKQRLAQLSETGTVSKSGAAASSSGANQASSAASKASPNGKVPIGTSPTGANNNNRIVRSNSGSINIPSPRVLLNKSPLRPTASLYSPNPSSSSLLGSATGATTASPSSSSTTALFSPPRQARPSLFRDQSLATLNKQKQLISPTEVQALWRKYDPALFKGINRKQLFELLVIIAESLHSIQLNSVAKIVDNTNRAIAEERLRKVFDEFRYNGRIEELTDEIFVQCTNRPTTGGQQRTSTILINWDSFQSLFFRSSYDKLIWELSK